MKALAKGKDNSVIETMIKHLINSTQGTQFESYLDDQGIRDIAEIVESDMTLYDKDELD
jgi:mono/diheme cytochrome c family protein